MKFILSIILLFLFVSPIDAQFGKTIAFKGASVNKTVGGGGGAIWTLIAHTTQVGQAGSGNTVTTGINTSGANLILIAVGFSDSTATATAVSDTIGGVASGNSWTAGTVNAFNPRLVFQWDLTTPSVGAAHVFTVAGASGFQPNVEVWAFAKTGGSPVLDSQINTFVPTDFWNNQPAQPGSITPATATDLLVSAVAWDDSHTSAPSFVNVNSSFSTPTIINVADSGGLSSAYKIKSDGTAENPTWTSDSVSSAACIHIGFK